MIDALASLVTGAINAVTDADPLVQIGVVAVLASFVWSVELYSFFSWLGDRDGIQTISIGSVFAAVVVTVGPFPLSALRSLAIPATGFLLLVGAGLYFVRGGQLRSWWVKMDSGIEQVAVVATIPVLLSFFGVVDVGIVDAHLFAFPAVGLTLVVIYRLKQK